MPRSIIMIGVPGSGKSFLAKKLESANYVRLSADSIRLELYGDENIQGDQYKIFGMLFDRFESALKAKKNIVIDNTNINKKARKRFSVESKEAGYRVDLWLMPLDLEKAIRQNNSRERQVPEEVIRKRFTALLANLPTEIEGNVIKLK